jgi:hypothetical protein
MNARELDVAPATPEENVLPAIEAQAVAEAFKRGPIGALLLSSISIGLLFIGWILFFFLLFMRRGPIG